MILSKTPLRISFFGGGSDLPEYYKQNNCIGSVLSTTIDVNMFIGINESPNSRIKACYSEIEFVESTKDLKHDRIRETLLHYNIHNNLEVSSFCDTPTKGTGLGSSSTYTVGLCNALSHFKGMTATNFSLADTAYHIERVRCRESLGKQDQYAAAFGGMNIFSFSEDESVEVTKINANYNLLQEHLMFFYTGVPRVANNILKEQANNTSDRNQVMREMVMIIPDAVRALQRGQFLHFGELLDVSWNLKKKMADGISNDFINEMYSDGIGAGAVGGKILGAGGGGFLMLLVPLNKQSAVREALSSFQEYKFKFSNKGSEIVYAD